MYSYAPGKMEKLRRFLADGPLGTRDYFVLGDLGISCHMPRQMLRDRSVQRSQNFKEMLPFDAIQAEMTIDLLLREGFIQEIDSTALSRIEKFLSEDTESLGPAHALPTEGTVDLTLKGADLYLRIREEVFGFPLGGSGWWALSDVDSRHVQVFGTTRSYAAEGFYDCVFHSDWYRVIQAGDIVEIGPWRDRWWKEFPHGWRIDAEVEPI